MGISCLYLEGYIWDMFKKIIIFVIWWERGGWYWYGCFYWGKKFLYVFIGFKGKMRMRLVLWELG